MKKLRKGFTMIELLIVIAVLGILAIAVLAAINPIEQINRGRDTGGRSDSEQLIGAVERYYTVNGFYPWRSSPTAGTDALAFTRLNALTAWQDDALVDVLTKLSAGGTAEIKDSFVSRIVGTGYNFLWAANQGAAGNSTYICFNGQSQAFQTEASERCAGTRGSIPGDLDRTVICNVTVDGEANQFITCLP